MHSIPSTSPVQLFWRAWIGNSKPLVDLKLAQQKEIVFTIIVEDTVLKDPLQRVYNMVTKPVPSRHFKTEQHKLKNSIDKVQCHSTSLEPRRHIYLSYSGP